MTMAVVVSGKVFLLLVVSTLCLSVCLSCLSVGQFDGLLACSYGQTVVCRAGFAWDYLPGLVAVVKVEDTARLDLIEVGILLGIGLALLSTHLAYI